MTTLLFYDLPKYGKCTYRSLRIRLFWMHVPKKRTTNLHAPKKYKQRWSLYLHTNPSSSPSPFNSQVLKRRQLSTPKGRKEAEVVPLVIWDLYFFLLFFEKNGELIFWKKCRLFFSRSLFFKNCGSVSPKFFSKKITPQYINPK